MNKVFIVGTACTALNEVYQHLVRRHKLVGCKNTHMEKVNHFIVQGQGASLDIIRLYRGEQAQLDKCHPLLWMVEELAREFPDASFVAMKRDLNATVNQMTKLSGVTRWCKEYKTLGVSFPNKFLGAESESIYRKLNIRERCKARAAAHFREIDRLAGLKELKGRFFVLDHAKWKQDIVTVSKALNIPVGRTVFPDAKPQPKPKPKPKPKPTAPRSRPTIPTKRPKRPKRPLLPVPVPHGGVGKRLPYPKCTFYWINLNRAPDRRKRMEQQFNDRGIKHERVVAFDGKNMNLRDYITKNWRDNQIRKYRCEHATTLSHLKALHTFVRNTGDDGFAIICEDDLSFEYELKWRTSLAELIDSAPAGWELLQLGIIIGNGREWNKMMHANRTFSRRKTHYWSAIAYAITKKAAVKLLHRFKVPVNHDEFKAQLSGNVALSQSERVILGTGPQRHFVYPPPFTYPMQNTSYIHPSHMGLHHHSKRLVAKAYP